MQKMESSALFIMNTSTQCSGKTTIKGEHWVLAWVDPKKKHITIWDPLEAPNQDKNILPSYAAKIKLFWAKKDITSVFYFLGHQNDSWSCGYRTLWWVLNLHHMGETPTKMQLEKEVMPKCFPEFICSCIKEMESRRYVTDFRGNLKRKRLANLIIQRSFSMALRLADTHFPKVGTENNGSEEQENKSLSSDEHQTAEGRSRNSEKGRDTAQQTTTLKEGLKIDQNKLYLGKRQRKEEKLNSLLIMIATPLALCCLFPDHVALLKNALQLAGIW